MAAGIRETLSKYADTIRMLNEEEQYRLFVALVDYAENGEIPEEQGNEKFVFSMIRKEMDEPGDTEKKSRSDINRENVQKRWNKRNTNTNLYENTNRISYENCDTKNTNNQVISEVNTNDTNRISYNEDASREKESIPSPLSPSPSSPTPLTTTPPIIPQLLKEKENSSVDSPDQGKKKRTRIKAADKPRHKHGEYGHVLLTDEEFERLAADFGESRREFLVTEMDEYAQLHGKTYEDWNLAIRKANKKGWFDRSYNNQQQSLFAANNVPPSKKKSTEEIEAERAAYQREVELSERTAFKFS